MPSRVSRRTAMSALLGTPAWLAGCGQPATAEPPLPPGALAGASVASGHRVRNHRPPPVAADAWERTRVAIVGGGVAGLTAAWQLARRGIRDVRLLELEPRVGGTSASGSSPVVSYPWGAHYVPAPRKENADLVELFREMGLVEGYNDDGEPVFIEQALCRDPEERLYYRGTWYEGRYLAAGASPLDQRQYRQFREQIDQLVAWRDADGRRAFDIPMAASSTDPELLQLDSLSMADWMASHGFTSPRLNWLVDYACRDDYGLRPRETSAWAGLFYFASRMAEPGGASQPLLTWPEGNGRIIRHLREAVADGIRTGLTVYDIAPAEHQGQPVLEVRALTGDDGPPVGLRADRVIFAAPRFVARHVIAPWRKAPPSHIVDFEYGAWVVANLFLKDRPATRGFPLCWDNVLYESDSLGYVAATHQRGLDYGPTVLTWYYPLCDLPPAEARRQLYDSTRDDWARAALDDLTRAHSDLPPLVERIDVMRWGHAMILPRPGFIHGTARSQAAEPFEGIHFAHSDLSGMALFEEAFYHGNRAAGEVAKALEKSAAPAASVTP